MTLAAAGDAKHVWAVACFVVALGLEAEWIPRDS